MSNISKIKFREASTQNTTVVSFENPNATTIQQLAEKAIEQLSISKTNLNSVVVKYRGNVVPLENAFRFSGLQVNTTVDLFLTFNSNNNMEIIEKKKQKIK